MLTNDQAVHAPTRSGRISGYGLTRAGRPLRVIYDELPDGIRVTTAYQIRRQMLIRIQEEAQQ